MAPGDGEEVIEARLLEVLDGRLVEAAVLAEEQGLEHRAGRGDVIPVGRRVIPFEDGLDAQADARDPGPDRAGRSGGVPADEKGRFRRGPAMDAERLQVSLIRERAEVPERAPGAQPGRDPDEVPGHEIEAPARAPDEGHVQAEPAADRSLLASHGGGPDVDEEDVTVELAARRPIETSGDVDIALRFEGVEGIGLVLAVEDGKAGRAQGRDGGQGQEGGRAVPPAGEQGPSRDDGGETGAPGRKRGESELGRRRDAEAESGRQEGERSRACS